MNTEPSRGGYRCVTTTFQTSSNEAWMIFAPNLLIASSFVSGALSGTITVQGILFWRACQARAWAMFPALQVYTPRFLAFGPARATALLAPRTLKEPVGCKFSSFRKISADASSMFKRTSGVRTTFPLIRSLASSISFSGIGRRSSELGTSFSSITDLQADAGSQLLNTNGAGRQYGSYEKGSCENWSRASCLPFSPAVKFGELLFVSGQGPIDKTGKVIPGDIRVQTKAPLENFKRIVEAAGSSMDCVLQTTVYVKDLAEYSAMNETYSSFFSDPKPARTTVQAGDLLFGMKVEIQALLMSL